MTAPTERFKRLCDVCAGYDDHPRHVTGVGPDFVGAVPDREFLEALPDGISALAIAEVLDPATVVRHIDCCAERGCGVCANTRALTKDAHGEALIKALTAGKADSLATTED